MKISKILFPLIVITMLFAGCKRYKEGPWFSLRFRETRIAGFWLFSKYELDGEDMIAKGLIGDSLAWVEFSKGGIYEVVNRDTSNDVHEFGAESGVWHMANGWRDVNVDGVDVKNGNMYIDKNDRFIEYSIIKLKNDDLKYEYDDVDNDDVQHHYEIHLVPKVL